MYIYMHGKSLSNSAQHTILNWLSTLLILSNNLFEKEICLKLFKKKKKKEVIIDKSFSIAC